RGRARDPPHLDAPRAGPELVVPAKRRRACGIAPDPRPVVATGARGWRAGARRALRRPSGGAGTRPVHSFPEPSPVRPAEPLAPLPVRALHGPPSARARARGRRLPGERHRAEAHAGGAPPPSRPRTPAPRGPAP